MARKGMSSQGRRQVMMALGNFQSREKRAGRPPSHATLNRIQAETAAELDASLPAILAPAFRGKLS